MDTDERLRHLLTDVAHELNNPLSVVLGQARLLCQALQGGPLHARAAKITRAAERCADIVRNVLVLGALRPPQIRLTSLNDTVHDVLRQFDRLFRRDGVEAELDLDADLPVAPVDPQQIREVILNLVANAHQAMAQHDAPRRVVLRTRHDTAAERLRLTIEDTGPGIAPGHLGRIFEPFFTTGGGGQQAGLGLTLCRGIVEQHGGTVGVESQSGRGTIVTVTLPTHPPVQAVAHAAPVAVPTVP